MCFQGGVEADVGDADGHPSKLACNRGEILEPGEDGGGAGGTCHVGKQADGGSDADAIEGYAARSWLVMCLKG